jgi:hypothetical protein
VAYSDGRSWSGGYLYGATVLLSLKGNGVIILLEMQKPITRLKPDEGLFLFCGLFLRCSIATT